MEMHHVRYFLALADTLNFTLAAERCGVSQPAMTRAVQQLESELGGRLFHRERQRTHLSELGRMMRPYFEAILSEADRARTAAHAFAGLEKARLEIGVMCTIGPSLVADFLAAFCRDYPQIETVVSDAPGESVKRRLLEGATDIGLIAEAGPVDERLHGIPLFTERFAAVAPAAHRIAQLDAVPCALLNDAPYANRTHCEYFDAISTAFQERSIRMRQVFSSERDDWVLAMIRSGLGLGIFPEHSVENQTGLVLRPLSEPSFERVVLLVTVRGRPHAPAVGAFLRALRNWAWPGKPSAVADGGDQRR